MYKYRFKTETVDFVIGGSDDYRDLVEAADADPDMAVKCYKILSEFLDNPAYCTPGHRNDHVVDSCICLAMLGIDPIAWFDVLYDNGVLDERDRDAAKEKAEVVQPYLPNYALNARIRDEWDFCMDHRKHTMILNPTAMVL